MGARASDAHAWSCHSAPFARLGALPSRDPRDQRQLAFPQNFSCLSASLTESRLTNRGQAWKQHGNIPLGHSFFSLHRASPAGAKFTDSALSEHTLLGRL